MLIFLVSLLPLVIIVKLKIPNKQFNFNLKPIIASKTCKEKNKSQYIIDDDNWEIISEQDAISSVHRLI